MGDEKKLQKLEEKLEIKEGQMSEFSRIISHDLRNPLNLAKGYLDLAKETESKEDMEEVKKALDHMEEIVDYILFIIDELEMIEKEEEVSLKSVVKNIRDRREFQTLTYEWKENPKVNADKQMLEDMVEKLISNSVKHNKEGVKVRFGSLEKGFFIEDTGTGIDHQTKNKIFNYGFSTKDDEEGVGLSKVDQISKAHGWNMNLTESEDGGARFEFHTN